MFVYQGVIIRGPTPNESSISVGSPITTTAVISRVYLHQKLLNSINFGIKMRREAVKATNIINRKIDPVIFLYDDIKIKKMIHRYNIKKLRSTIISELFFTNKVKKVEKTTIVRI